MITAIIRNRENTLVLDFPRSIYDLYEKLQSVGIMKSPKQIPLTDNEDEDIGVKLFSESDFGQHLLLTLNEKNTIADANNSIDLQIRIAEIDAEFKKMLDRVSTDTIEAFDEETATRLMNEKSRLQQQLDSIADAEQRRENAKSRLDDIYTILDGIKNRPMEYDDQIVRQLLECIVVDSKEQITVIFKGGLKSVQPLTE